MSILKLTESKLTALAVTNYGDELITFTYACFWPILQKIFRFYKLKRESNSVELFLDREVIVVEDTFDANTGYYEEPKLHVLKSADLGKPIIVFGSKIRDKLVLEVYLLSDMKMIAKEVQYVNRDWTYPHTRFLFTVWKGKYLVDNLLRVLQLKPNDDQPKDEAAKQALPYKICWTGGIPVQVNTVNKILNAGDKLFILVRRKQQEYSRFLYYWDELTSTVNLTPHEFNTDNFSVFQRNRVEGDILLAGCLGNKIITVIDKRKIGPRTTTKKVFVWSLKGEGEYEITANDGNFFLWNGSLVEIVYPEEDQEDEPYAYYQAPTPEVPPTLYFSNVEGRLMNSVTMELPGFYVWNQYLVAIHRDKMIIYYSNSHSASSLTQSVSTWHIERLLWLAFMKNKGNSPLALLPKEILMLIAQLIRANPCVMQVKTTSTDTEQGTKRKTKKQEGRKPTKKRTK